MLTDRTGNCRGYFEVLSSHFPSKHYKNFEWSSKIRQCRRRESSRVFSV